MNSFTNERCCPNTNLFACSENYKMLQIRCNALETTNVVPTTHSSAEGANEWDDCE